MKLNEITLNPDDSTFERLKGSTLSDYETLYKEIERYSDKFTKPAREIYSRDYIYELILDLDDILLFLKTQISPVPNSIQMITELVQYLDQ